MTDINEVAGHQVVHDRSDLIVVREEPFNAETPPDALRLPITPTRAHYVRSNFALPGHDGRLVVDGAVERPVTLTMDDLRALPQTTLAVTLECAGNGRLGLRPLPEGEPWANHAIGTATWTGTRLVDVLAQVRPQPDGVEVAFEGADRGPYKGGPEIGFARSLPLDYACRPDNDVLLAYGMNDEPLTPDHGAPLRLVVPGWYGMASVKWLAHIEVRTAPFEGRFQTFSYVYYPADRDPFPVTTMRVKALVTEPVPGAQVQAGEHVVRGKAWSGSARDIARVEVSVDAGEWQLAQLQPATGSYAWQEWSFNWMASEPGRHVLRARATDADGNTQPDTPEWNRLGYGNNAVVPAVVAVHR